MDNLVVLLGILGTLGAVVATMNHLVKPIKMSVDETKDEMIAMRGEMGDLRVEMHTMGAELRGEMKELRVELKDEMAAGFAEAAADRKAIREEIQVTRKELRAEISALDYKYDKKIDMVRADIFAISRDLRPNADSAFRNRVLLPTR
jgi:hypothetical protein